MSKYSGHDWSQSMIEDIWTDITKIAAPYGLDYYEPQIEIISSEQMLDNYSTTGLPVYYPHWSFGKTFSRDKDAYEKGKKGLAFEIVINTDPSICYIMDNNTLALQILVLAHAAVGHSAFFKNNYLFKEHTDAAGIIDFLIYARNYIFECEEKYGMSTVENFLDACHALHSVSIDKSKAPRYKSDEFIATLDRAREEAELKNASPLWDSLFPKKTKRKGNYFYEENILKYVSKYSTALAPWQQNIINICLYLNQYFYPQMQTQVANEGFATFWHHHLMHDMYENDLIDDGIMLEFLDNHAGVIHQSPALYKDRWGDIQANPYYRQINPYYLGFNMFSDIKRICENPTEQDKKDLPGLIGQDWVETIKEAAYFHNDSTFIGNYLSAKVMDSAKLFILEDDSKKDEYNINSTVAEAQYPAIRSAMAKQYDLERRLPQLRVRNNTDNPHNILWIEYLADDEKLLHKEYTQKTLSYLRKLWGNTVHIIEPGIDTRVLFSA